MNNNKEGNKDILYPALPGNLSIQPSLQPNQITFYQNSDRIVSPILELRANGDIFVKGKLIENDIEVVDAMREFLTGQRLLKK
jgi:hypothetical protein